MDNEIEEIKRRAGIVSEAGQTFTLGSQDQIETLIKNEREWLAKVATYLNRMGSYEIKRNLIPVMRKRIDDLARYEDKAKKDAGEGEAKGQNFNAKV